MWLDGSTTIKHFFSLQFSSPRWKLTYASVPLVLDSQSWCRLSRFGSNYRRLFEAKALLMLLLIIIRFRNKTFLPNSRSRYWRKIWITPAYFFFLFFSPSKDQNAIFLHIHIYGRWSHKPNASERQEEEGRNEKAWTRVQGTFKDK